MRQHRLLVGRKLRNLSKESLEVNVSLGPGLHELNEPGIGVVVGDPEKRVPRARNQKVQPCVIIDDEWALPCERCDLVSRDDEMRQEAEGIRNPDGFEIFSNPGV